MGEEVTLLVRLLFFIKIIGVRVDWDALTGRRVSG